MEGAPSPDLNQACADYGKIDTQSDPGRPGEVVPSVDDEHHGGKGVKIVVVPAEGRKKRDQDEEGRGLQELGMLDRRSQPGGAHQPEDNRRQPGEDREKNGPDYPPGDGREGV